jgi:Tol biopolymer transport system component/predicted Ser/Thr protein kinase
MTIAPGSRLGPYEIIAPIGSGGMGEVWKARDTRLDRSVAVKVLPGEFAQNAQLRMRFEREAKTISQLDHPHICTLFDVGDDYLVMEYLEGESLADRLTRGPLPLSEVLRLGTQIAQALDRAHRAGVVHRDLKPGNIMLTKSGAKLLDFGLARSTIASAPTDATQHKPLTAEGVILGTYQYMSPEQIAGEEADARSDIFSFGAVLYEMLTGKRAFEGKSKTSIVAAIVSGEPRAISQLQPMTPPALEHVIAKCLAKEPDARWQSAADIATELEWIAHAPVVEARKKRPLSHFVTAALLAIVAAAGIATAMYLERRLNVAERPLRAQLDTPVASILAGAVALSPDGTRLVFVKAPMSRAMLTVRNLATGGESVLAGTEDASYPFWSPDGKRVGFFAQRKLKTISADGGPATDICDVQYGRGGSWNRDGTIVFAPDLVGAIYKVTDGGGAPVAVTHPPKDVSDRNPFFLPDGERFLYTEAIPSKSVGELCAGSIDGKLQRRIGDNVSNMSLDGGRLFFLRDGNLVAAGFDAKTLKLLGAPVALASDVEYYAPRNIANFSVAANTVAYVPRTVVDTQVEVFDRNGRSEPVGTPGPYRVLDVSPDGKRIVINTAAPKGDIWIVQTGSGLMSRITFDEGEEPSASFSPDGSRLATLVAKPGSVTKLAVVPVDGGAAEVLANNGSIASLNGWSADGKYLIVGCQNPGTSMDVAYFDVQQKKIGYIVRGEANEFRPSLSPNGKWLAYTSTESGSPQIYVTAFPSGHGRWQVTATGAIAARWSPDGKHLFFTNPDAKLFVSDFSDSGGPQFGAARELAGVSVRNGGLLPDFAPTRDGRIVSGVFVGNTTRAPVHLIVNWSKVLSR